MKDGVERVIPICWFGCRFVIAGTGLSA